MRIRMENSRLSGQLSELNEAVAAEGTAEAIAEAKDRMITKIGVLVRSDNKTARDFYERNGFVHEGSDSRLFYIDGKYISGEHYGLEL